MTKDKQLFRTCAACGLDKPLSAFLQLGSEPGTHYGFVCATCRKEGRTPPSNIITDDESTTVKTGKRIGSKEKVFAAKEKKLKLKDLKELFRKEVNDKSNLDEKKKKLKKLKDKVDLDRRKKEQSRKSASSFWTKDNKNQSGIRGLAKKTSADKKHFRTKEQILDEIRKHEEVLQQEGAVTSLDLSNPAVAGQTNQIKFYSETFLKYKTWLGISSPLVRTLERLYGELEKHFGHEMKQSSGKAEHSNAKESIKSYIDDNSATGPSPSKKR